jgi:hypothetical protein
MATTPQCNEDTVICMCDYRRSLNWRLDSLTTLAHDSELQVLTAPSLISTLYKSPKHTLRVLQPAVTSLVVSWQRFLTAEILQLPLSHHSRLATISQLNYQLTKLPISASLLPVGTGHVEKSSLQLFHCYESAA